MNEEQRIQNIIRFAFFTLGALLLIYGILWELPPPILERLGYSLSLWGFLSPAAFGWLLLLFLLRNAFEAARSPLERTFMVILVIASTPELLWQVQALFLGWEHVLNDGKPI